jgi:phosphoglycolate phosphatase
MIYNILFDLDGTLTDPKEGITKCIQEALDKLGQPVPSSDELEWCIGPGLYGSFEKLLDSRDQKLIQKAINLYRARYTKKGIFENYVYPGIPDTLDKLKKMDLRLFVATSKPTVFAREVVINHHLDGFFEGIYGIELNGERSDKGKLISFILRRESLIDKQTLMIGDREHDIIGAKSNRIYAGGVLYGYGSEEELTQAGADYLFAKPMDIVEYYAEDLAG